MSKLCECGNLAAPQRSVCYKCRSKNIREKNPIRAIFYELKRSAKRRGYEFTLTIEYLTKIAEEHDLLNNRGRESESFSIDRIINEKGYGNDNVQILTKSQNSAKYWADTKHLRDLDHCIEPGETFVPPF